MGFWDVVTLTEAEEEQIREAYRISFVEGDVSKVETLYQKDEIISVAANKILNKKANVGWMSSNHSAGFVPVFAIGVGAESFSHLMARIHRQNRRSKLGRSGRIYLFVATPKFVPTFGQITKRGYKISQLTENTFYRPKRVESKNDVIEK